MPAQRQLRGRFGVDMGQAADGSGEPHTEFDLQRATSEDRPLDPLRWRVAEVVRKSSAVLPTDRLLMWAMRAVWALLPAALVASLAAGLETRSDGVRLLIAVGVWAAWAVVLGALFVPNTVTLTIVRVLVPASIPVVALVVSHGGFDVGDGLALAAAIVATALCFLPSVGAVCLHGVAYGDEERVALRAPGILLLGPIEIAWIVLLVAAATGPLLLAARQWVAGAVLTIAGLAVVAALARALHQLARRWLVFVPSGVVLHDPLGLVDPVLLTRARVRSFAAALADTEASDLTMGSPGLAVEIGLTQKTEMVRREGRSGTTPLVATAVLVTPTRPGVAVSIAARRRVGQAPSVRGGPSPSP